ncbi:ephrin type-B receptor 3-like [Tubulanus polymorphus]|uniref:ephrin type-B receptor 3-like n=1 Tax=Tubulanus polymorphus TaxID=672921 RepID=UPI003DA2DFFB
MAKDSTLWNTALGLYWILTNLLVLTLADEVVLLDTTQETQGDLNWQTYPPNTGWQEASFNMGLDTVRVNTVCMIDQQESKNWLRTPFIPRGNAKRLYIEMKFTMRECTQYPDPQNLQQCKETFNLLYYEAESDYANSMLPRWDTITYRHIDVVAADSKFSSINNAVINTEVRSVAINQKGVYFAFMDMGACVTLIAVRIYYKICPEVTLNFAKFLATPTGSDSSSIYPATGECVANSAMESEPTYQCKANGEWYLNSGGCQCLPAFMPATNKHQCIELNLKSALHLECKEWSDYPGSG